MGVYGQRHAPADLPPGKTLYPLYRRLGGPQGRSRWVRKISPPPGLDTRTVQPVKTQIQSIRILSQPLLGRSNSNTHFRFAAFPYPSHDTQHHRHLHYEHTIFPSLLGTRQILKNRVWSNYCNLGTGKVSSVHAIQVGIWRNRGTVPPSPNLRTWGWIIIFKIRPFYLQREPPFTLSKRLSGLQEWSTRFGEDTTVDNITFN
jgi:hypothetical protein